IGAEVRSLRVIIFIRLFHGVEMIEDAIELVEAVHCGKVFVTIAKMILADLRRCVTKWLEKLGDGRILVLNTLFGGGQADRQQTRAKRRLSQDKRGTTRRAGLLSVVVGEQCAFLGDAV